jgi:hypothetical protein
MRVSQFVFPALIQYFKIVYRSVQMSRIPASAFSLAKCRAQATDPLCSTAIRTLCSSALREHQSAYPSVRIGQRTQELTMGSWL